jgi:hypothetical protein
MLEFDIEYIQKIPYPDDMDSTKYYTVEELRHYIYKTLEVTERK